MTDRVWCCWYLVFGALFAGCSPPPPPASAHCPADEEGHETSLPELSAENHRKAVASVVELLRVKEQLERCSTDLIAAQIRMNPDLESYRDILEQFIRKYMSWSAVEPELMDGYMERLSQREAEELAGFLQTPLGRKWARAQPELNQRMLAFGEAVLVEHKDELVDAVAARNRELQQVQSKEDAK